MYEDVGDALISGKQEINVSGPNNKFFPNLTSVFTFLTFFRKKKKIKNHFRFTLHKFRLTIDPPSKKKSKEQKGGSCQQSAQSEDQTPQADSISAELIIHVNGDTQLQTIKGRCQQLNPNKILIRIWSCSVRQKSACECVNAWALSAQTPPPLQKFSQKSSSQRSVTAMARMSLLIWSKQTQLWLAVAFGPCVLSSLAACVCGAAAIWCSIAELGSWSQRRLLQDVWLKQPRRRGARATFHYTMLIKFRRNSCMLTTDWLIVTP